MGFLSWIIFGALAGWAAGLIVGGSRRRHRGCVLNVLVGVVGATLGGFVYRLATGEPKTFAFDFPSFGVAVLGAVLLLAVLQLLERR
ncbi:GlsB/YeaQ/YmgE family stress response membrane protein [Saccharomonospora xinjiangensis]|uniref:Putative membrane protein n=1 Tax=Saccharomonospora xinjiangensis XJ-54 TaxID=882086 RepID=I0V417_9PSEU|nr:GlsB/YeaQ/YmgE family stress response membrane protein [Saccharomonospora xinjiangensis]EID54870.1 putative membrane protein [Saccharomonospora xinjiangensis XJ-54]